MNGEQPQFDDLSGPAKLQAGLRNLYAPTRSVPADLDRLILSSARADSLRRGRLRQALRWTGGAAAAAAVLFVAIRFYPRTPAPSQPAPGVVAVGGEDLNNDGKVDMLDAYLLARRVELNQSLSQSLDFNHDGIVNKKDADTIALDAVRLKPEGVQ